jgi:predicted NBD/HSP70 family sugar kinase
VLDLVRRSGPLSRADLARATLLSKPTVSLALSRLEQAGLVRETGRASGGRGPSAALYELNARSGWVVGVDVGRHWIRAALADIAGTIVARRSERTQARSAAAVVAQIGAITRRVAEDAGLDFGAVTHTTVGSTGVLDPHGDSLVLAPNLPGWGRPGLARAIRELLGGNVSFENDVNLAALGERALGAGRDARSFVFLWVGTGVGLGLVLDGRLYRGTSGAAGEIAYLPLGAGDPHDRAARRRGMLEESAGAAGVVRMARELGMRPPLTAKKIFAAARRGDPIAGRVIEQEARRLALALAAVAAVVDPELVILGGGLARSGDLLLAPIARELSAVSPFRPRLAVSELGEEAVLQGALATALEAAQERLFDRVRDLDAGTLVS